jgi:hypothetical protein
MATSPNFNWPEPDNTDLVKNGALAIRTAVDAIDSSLVDLKGGTTGQVLSKASGTDMDFAWVSDAAGMTNPMTTTGDTIYSSSGSTPARLGIGTTGQVLTVSGGVPSWATPAGGGGKVLQVVQDTLTSNYSNSTSTFTDTGLTVTITPSATTSRIMVLLSAPGIYSSNGSGSVHNYSNVRVLRDATELQRTSFGTYNYASSNNPDFYTGYSVSYVDSPATTSAVTYKFQMSTAASTLAAILASATSIASITVMEIGA